MVTHWTASPPTEAATIRKVLRLLSILMAACFFFAAGWDAPAATPKKKPAAKSASKSKSVRPSSRTKARRGTPTRRYSRATRGRGRGPAPVQARRYRGQQAPSRERYVEIQNALITRGFLTGEPSGTWDSASIDAMKRFQEGQNLPPNGKLTSLSIIALGLGPKRNTLPGSASAVTPPAAVEPPPSPVQQP